MDESGEANNQRQAKVDSGWRESGKPGEFVLCEQSLESSLSN